MTKLASDIPKDYAQFLDVLKKEISHARIKAVFAVNSELVLLYWKIGDQILKRQEQEGWGTKVIQKLAEDLGHAFPEMRGLSSRNLVYMRTFANAYPKDLFTQQPIAQIPWGHHARILDHVKEPAERLWYIKKTIENGWSQNVLVHQIETGLYERKGQVITNFKNTMPDAQSDLTHQLFHDPYNLEFLDIREKLKERQLEEALVNKIRDFLLELGAGFAFVGNQYKLNVAGDDYYIDLLLYHIKLHRYIVVELKNGPFKPEYTGKLNFYLSAVDGILRGPGDEPSIGLILCKSKNKVVVEYSLQDSPKPMGVSTYQLPKKLKEILPSIEQLRDELKNIEDGNDGKPTK